MTLAYLIERIRTTLYQHVPSGESVSTRTQVKFSVGTKFSDADLTERIIQAEYTLFNIVDASNLPNHVAVYGGTLPRLDPSQFTRVLDRVFRDNVRCIRRPVQTHRQVDNSLRSATAEYPAYTLGENYLRTYPAGGSVSVWILKAVPDITLTNRAAITDQLEEALVQLVAQGCRLTMGEEGFDVEMNRQMAKWHEKQFVKEVTPYLRNTNLTSYADQEVTVERHTA